MPNYNENLAECPFCRCHGDAIVFPIWKSPFDVDPKGYRIVCKNCEAGTGIKKTIEEAIQFWNMWKEKNSEDSRSLEDDFPWDIDALLMQDA
jgi:hypothetical protein